MIKRHIIKETEEFNSFYIDLMKQGYLREEMIPLNPAVGKIARRNLPILVELNTEKKLFSYQLIDAFENLVGFRQGDIDSDTEEPCFTQKIRFISDKTMSNKEICEVIRKKYATKRYTYIFIIEQKPIIKEEEYWIKKS